MKFYNKVFQVPFALIAFTCMFILTGYISDVQARTKSYFILDVNTGHMIDEVNGDRKLHPASLTKMMTLYMAFEALQRGQLSLDSKIRVSKRAADMVPSKIGFKVGQTVTFREVIHASAVKSANDAAVVIAEAIAGTEWAFAKRMTQKARAMGMNSTTFKNASGLTAKGHLSTSRDMAILGMRLFKDFPQHYGLFERRSANYRGRTLLATNRRFLRDYKGADGIKTGYTRAAGFNLVASAEKDDKRVIVSYFGADSSYARNKRVAELMNIGFKKAKTGSSPALVAIAPLPVQVPGRPVITQESWVSASLVTPQKMPQQTDQPDSAWAKADVPEARPAVEKPAVESQTTVVKSTIIPLSQKEQSLFSKSLGTIQKTIIPRAEAGTRHALSQQSGNWGIQLGAFREQEQAQNRLHQALIIAKADLDQAYRAIDPHEAKRQKLYRARFTGLSQSTAKSACRSLSSQGMSCVAVPPESW